MGHKRTRPRPARLQAARHWIPTYTGKNIVKGYKKKFSVDILAAIRDLQELGIDISPEYIASVENSEKHRIMQLQAKKQERLAEQQALEEQYNEMLFLDDYHNYDDYSTVDIMNNHRINYENKIGNIKKAGKNHVRVNGTLLQTNKKWSQLKQKQRDWIYEITREKHLEFITESKRLPLKTGKKKLIANITSKIDERGIWLPSCELERGIGKYIDKLNRRASIEKSD